MLILRAFIPMSTVEFGYSSSGVLFRVADFVREKCPLENTV